MLLLNKYFGDDRRQALNEHYLLEVDIRLFFQSRMLERRVTVDIYLPTAYYTEAGTRYKVLFFNDGQDMEAVGLKNTLHRLYHHELIEPVIVVAIHAGENRLQEYGVAGQPDSQNRGSQALHYTRFVMTELLPFVRQQYRTAPGPAHTFFAGFSLGGLSAFDIVWNHPETFGGVGAFSGSFWWRSKELNEGYTEADRIAHQMVKASGPQPGLKFWFQVGTNDERNDRNQSGIIDAIEDTLDLVEELENFGYIPDVDLKYVELLGGEHNPETWGEVLPDFLVWAYGTQPPQAYH